jgi:hypothetical protein
VRRYEENRQPVCFQGFQRAERDVFYLGDQPVGLCFGCESLGEGAGRARLSREVDGDGSAEGSPRDGSLRRAGGARRGGGLRAGLLGELQVDAIAQQQQSSSDEESGEHISTLIGG